MPKIVVDKLDQALQARRSTGLIGARILVAGLAYKKNINDIRESPALIIMELVRERGGAYDYADPHAPIFPLTREHAELQGQASVDLTPASIRRYDAVLLVADHDVFDYDMIARNAALVIDTRNAFGRRGLMSPNVLRA